MVVVGSRVTQKIVIVLESNGICYSMERYWYNEITEYDTSNLIHVQFHICCQM